GGTKQFTGGNATPRASFAAHFEQIGEVVIEQQRQIEARRKLSVILHADSLVTRSAPQKDGADDVQHVLLQYNSAVAIDVGIGQVDLQCRIVIAQIRAEQQGLDFVEHEFEPGEVTGIGI